MLKIIDKLKIMISILVLIIGYISITPNNCAEAITLEERIRNDSDLSEFYSLIERDEVATTALKHRSLTVFAPTNRAFQHHKLSRTFVLYHMVTSAFTLENLPQSVLSDLDGNPPLYINTQAGDIFVNNAKIVKSKSNEQFTTAKGNKQILHIIEEILVPLVPSPTSSLDNNNLDAFQFITYSESLDIEAHRVRTFRHRVIINKKEKMYQDTKLFTFFLPVEEGFKQQLRTDLIDSKVIDGHIIPGNVLFTSSVKIDEPYPTLTFEENLRVTISFFQDHESGKEVKTFVRSDTIVGDGVHTNGGVIAEIVKANIPVRNGVIHLISKPLMVVDNAVNQFLEDRDGGPLTKFHEIILDYGGDFMEKLKDLQDVTLFAPNNEAWQDKNIQKMLGDRHFIREILDLHVVPMRANVERIKQNIANKHFFVPTLAARKSLFFNIVNFPDREQIITVEGGGVNATITQADVAATNGYIHIIDHVLGAPYTTVLEKLKQDPLMRKTYELGESTGFNKRLNDTRKRFTYFVPAEQAWALVQKEMPSVHKKLFMADFQYHVNIARNLLERHLVVADRKFTMGELKVLANDSLVLSTVRDSLKIKVKEDKQYYIFWDDKWLTVVRPDVDCTNGIIHVISSPFIRSNDIVVSGDPFSGSNTLKTFNAITFLCILFASIFHIYI